MLEDAQDVLDQVGPLVAFTENYGLVHEILQRSERLLASLTEKVSTLENDMVKVKSENSDLKDTVHQLSYMLVRNRKDIRQHEDRQCKDAAYFDEKIDRLGARIRWEGMESKVSVVILCG